ncbi:MAG: class II glutamine amidotransferase, partial [Clostridium sp.]|nr:class II glutamine amidotransferase [Clostridium sp.]
VDLKIESKVEREGKKMCELFGINAKETVFLNNYLKEFFAHSKAHPHGWGMACMNGKELSIEKEPLQASKSNYLKERLTVPIEAKNALAHIRYATIGNVDYKNCHPYTGADRSGRHWTMIHNGTIFKYEPLNPYLGIQTGSTDSERILLYIVDCINGLEERLKRRADAKERFQLLDSIIAEMAEGNKLNLLLYDGELFYVHTNYENSLYKLEQKNRIIFSTSPLGKEEWKPVTFTTLLAYQQGRLLYQGRNHGNVYVDNEENLKYLYSIFSNL